MTRPTTPALQREQTLAAYAQLVRTIGTGFHPDTPFGDYVPPITAYTEAEFEAVLDAVFGLEPPCDPYAIGLAIWHELTNEQEGTT